jgi:hypothetical protein
MASRTADKARESSDLAPLPRIRLDSLTRVRMEMAQIYREAKHGRRDVADASKLANMLALIGRLLTEHEFEERLLALERASGQGHQP